MAEGSEYKFISERSEGDIFCNLFYTYFPDLYNELVDEETMTDDDIISLLAEVNLPVYKKVMSLHLEYLEKNKMRSQPLRKYGTTEYLE